MFLLHGHNPEDIDIVVNSDHLVNQQIYSQKKRGLTPPVKYWFHR